jgi:hypothetical protein
MKTKMFAHADKIGPNSVYKFCIFFASKIFRKLSKLLDLICIRTLLMDKALV